MQYDTIIVGGGPAGMNAGIVLGRCGRRVLLVDAGKPRNFASRHVHNFLTQDAIHPAELRRLGRAELARYAVEIHDGLVTSAQCVGSPGFAVEIDHAIRHTSRTLLLATGVLDELPALPGLPELYGRGVHHCPYCDAFEYRGLRLGAYGEGRPGLGLALSLITWSSDILVVTDGTRLSARDRREAERFQISVREQKIIRLVGRAGPDGGDEGVVLDRIDFVDGPPESVAAMFFNTEQFQRSALPAGLGCRMNEVGGVAHDKRQRTGVPGLYLAGDASKDVQFVIVAAAEGAKAGVAINADLQKLDRAAKRPPRVG